MKPLTSVSFSFYSCCLWLLFATSLCTLCTCNQSSNQVQCIATERLALIEFKNSLEDRPNRLSSWSGDDCCSWSGVVCDNSTHHVHEIRLRGPDDGLHGHCHGWDAADDEAEEARKEMLGGIISQSLIKLQQLRYLDLSCNDFGLIQIPTFIGSFKNLRYLNISRSQFAGEIPHQLGNLSELLVLDLQDDTVFVNLYLKNLKWIKNLKRLQYLDMSGIDLTGATDWLQVINTLPYLQQLHLSSCSLTQFPTEPTRVNFTSLFVLDLSHNFFTNFLPEWIFSLHDLVSLDLTNCYIGGLNPGTRGGFDSMHSLRILRLSTNTFVNSNSILKGFPSLSNIRLLDVSYCNLSESILGNLQNLSQIVHLDLSFNQIVWEIPRSLSNLCNLTTLDLQSNYFSGDVSELLERFCECESPKLELLALRNNHLIGRLPEKLGRLKNLVSIDIAYNRLSGFLPHSLGSMLLLKSILLYTNQFEGSIPDTIGNLSSLQVLDLSYNKLKGTLPKSIGKLRKLSTLRLNHNSLTGIVTKTHFVNLTNLYIFWVAGNKLSFDLVNNWIPPFQLTTLSLGSCNLGPLFPSWVQSQTKLHVLNLSNTNISDTIPDSWMNLESLIFLNLEKNKLSGKIPSSLGNIPSLEILLMRNNKLSGDLPVSLLNSKSLVIVDLAENELTGRIPMSIRGRYYDTSLKVLSLRSNKLEGEIPTEICHLSSIQILDVADNNFSGYLQTCFTNFSFISGKKKTDLSLPYQIFFQNKDEQDISLVIKGHVSLYSTILGQVTALDFSKNKFSGSIPNELVELSGLRYLNLSQNNLTGRIPNTFSEMGELESLDLSVNNLWGKIPLSLVGLTALNLLNVSYNNLTGTIPTSHQFETFNDESCFIGNKLCGGPLPKCRQNSDDTHGVNDYHDEPDNIDWILVICMIVGLAVGFWIMIGTLIVSKQWRDAYYRFLDEVWLKLANFVFLISIFGRRIIHRGSWWDF